MTPCGAQTTAQHRELFRLAAVGAMDLTSVAVAGPASSLRYRSGKRVRSGRGCRLDRSPGLVSPTLDRVRRQPIGPKAIAETTAGVAGLRWHESCMPSSSSVSSEFLTKIRAGRVVVPVVLAAWG